MNITALNTNELLDTNRLNANKPAQHKATPAQAREEVLEAARMEKSDRATRQQELVNRLMSMSDVRSEVVEANRPLADDPAFPSRDELTDLARALLRPLA